MRSSRKSTGWSARDESADGTGRRHRRESDCHGTVVPPLSGEVRTGTTQRLAGQRTVEFEERVPRALPGRACRRRRYRGRPAPGRPGRGADPATGAPGPRHLSVNVDRVLDLRSASARWTLGLPFEILTSTTANVLAYQRCREVANVAHQLGLTGVVAPAAGGIGSTLALFPDRLAASERPVRTADDVVWTSLPPDPRRAPARPQLRIARADDQGS